LATRTLRKANLIGAEEVPSAADLEYIEEGIASDTAALAIEGIVIWNGSDMSVPLEHLEPRARYHAITAKEDFGMISAEQASAAREMEKRALRRLSTKVSTGAAQEASYF
jgi:hypothetical protein